MLKYKHSEYLQKFLQAIFLIKNFLSFKSFQIIKIHDRKKNITTMTVREVKICYKKYIVILPRITDSMYFHKF